MLEIEYPSQKQAYPFFITVAVLFVIQVSYGLTIALQQIDPYLLRGIANFNVNRGIHLNLAILWILVGLAGAIIFTGPRLAKRDLAQPWLARVLLVAMWIVVVWAFVTLPLMQIGKAGWALGQPWFQQGLEFLEIGRAGGLAIWIALIMLAYLVLRIFPKPSSWNELHWGLFIGLAAVAVVWAFGLFFVKTLDLQEFFRWFVVHYWVEASWEILYTTLVGLLLVAMFDAETRTVGIAVFWAILLVVLAGFIGNGHHYFWIGTPAVWQFWGSIFSAMEPLPIFLAVWHIARIRAHTAKPLENRPAFYFIFGSALLYLVGAGVLGFTQTLAQTNVWEHGTWVTPAHAHLALFGTFGMLVLGAAYAIVPATRRLRGFDDRLSIAAFWVILSGILGMTLLAFAPVGTAQVFVYRVLGLDWFRFEVRPAMQVFRVLLFVFGSVLASGVLLFAYDLLTLAKRAGSGNARERVAPSRGWWRAPMSTGELIGWVFAIVAIGLLLTTALASSNLESVRLGDSTLPFTLAGIGYPSLAGVTIAFALRFLRSQAASG